MHISYIAFGLKGKNRGGLAPLSLMLGETDLESSGKGTAATSTRQTDCESEKEHDDWVDSLHSRNSHTLRSLSSTWSCLCCGEGWLFKINNNNLCECKSVDVQEVTV